MDIDLKYLDTLQKISINFNISLDFLEYMYSKNESKIPYFGIVHNKYLSEINLPKKNIKRRNEYRKVLKIESPYNIFYKELLRLIELIIQKQPSNFIHTNVHGFVKNKNILTNAREHLNKDFLLKIDIKKFFNSIKRLDIKNIFINLGLNEKSADLFSHLCTYNGILQEGLNTSPILANLYCFELDIDLINLSNEYKVTYTRYGDDITFSSNNNSFPKIKELQDILYKYNFELNQDKTIFLKRGQSQYVTGLSISNKDYPRVPRRLKRRIRQKLYYLQKFPEENLLNYHELRRLYGNIIYTIGIERKLGKQYKTQFLNILHKYGYGLIDVFSDDRRTKLNNTVFHYIDETGIKFNEDENQYHLGLCVVSINGEELKSDNQKIILNLRNEIISDYRNGLNDEQRKKLFHYVDDNPDVKGKYLQVLRDLQFEAYIAYKRSEDNKPKFSEDYYDLFNKLLYKILRKFKDYKNFIYFEENNKILQNKLNENLKNLKGLPSYKIAEVKKSEVLVSIPDYILGIFGECIKNDFTERISKLRKLQTLKEERKLNEILNKIRFVHDIDKNLYFSRKDKQLNCRDINKNLVETIKTHKIYNLSENDIIDYLKKNKLKFQKEFNIKNIIVGSVTIFNNQVYIGLLVKNISNNPFKVPSFKSYIENDLQINVKIDTLKPYMEFLLKENYKTCIWEDEE